jgi:Domain of unknown function (DUF4209)
MGLSAADARRAVLEASQVELWEIGSALGLDTDTTPIEAVPIVLLSDVLSLGDLQNWKKTARPGEVVSEPFRANFTQRKDDGNIYRSFEPGDMAAEHEEPLRRVAVVSKNEYVRARIYEVLWIRFRRYRDAQNAIAARVATFSLIDRENWPRLVTAFGRCAWMILTVNAKDRLPDYFTALDGASATLASSSRPFAVTALADMLNNVLLGRSDVRDAFGADRFTQWRKQLRDIAEHYRGDDLHGQDALVVLQDWHQRCGDSADANLVRHEMVQRLVALAKVAAPMFASSLIQRALKTALDFGLQDELEPCRVALGEAIRKEIPHFAVQSSTIEIPRPAIQEIDGLLTTQTIAGALRVLAAAPGFLDVDINLLTERARQSMKESPFFALIPAQHVHREGKVTYRSDPNEPLERYVGLGLNECLVGIEALLGYFMQQSLDRWTPSTLIEALAAWPHLNDARRRMLEVSAERFARRDWVSSGTIVVTVYEAALRDLLRASGYSALRLEPNGVQMDETLNQLVRSPRALEILRREHCSFVEFFLCDPKLGPNLRNEVAHGTVRVEDLSPTRVLLVWLLLLRLTCFVANRKVEKPETPDNTTADANSTENRTTKT